MVSLMKSAGVAVLVAVAGMVVWGAAVGLGLVLLDWLSRWWRGF